jgi:hypothetical protein|tara:strand:+ start:2338 stop:2931 length:594 start_codon:yes stop_codon:yes gene_type:complete
MTTKLPQIILLSGLKRSGKDTVANYIQKTINYKHIKISSKMKECIKLLFNLNDDDLEDKKEIINDTWSISTRKIMQFVGTDIFQFKIQELLPDIGRSFWIKSLINDEYNNITNLYNYNIVISDLRFLHEMNEIKKLNIPFIHIRIINPSLCYEVDTHISENEFYQIPYDYEIINDSSLEKLYSNINNLIKNNLIKNI